MPKTEKEGRFQEITNYFLDLTQTFFKEDLEMTYNEFQNKIVELLNGKLDENTEARIHKTLKNNNCTLTGVVIDNRKVNASPVIYLEEFFKQYQNGTSLEQIIANILAIYEEIKCKKSLDETKIKNYENIKNKIVFKVINTERNNELLKNVPHIHFLDLSIVFYALLDAYENGTATMLVSNDNLEMWDINLQNLYDDAIRNVKCILPAELIPMKSMMEEIINPCFEKENILETRNISGTEVMFVLTNKLRNLGSACILYPGMFQLLADILKSSYYILPSSTHETLILCDNAAMSIEEMNLMVRAVNNDHVDLCDLLSDHVYFYDRKTHLVHACSDPGKWVSISADFTTLQSKTIAF